MKKLLMASFFMTFACLTYAQIDLKKPAASADVTQMGKGIVDMLASKLNLTALQSPKVSSLVSTFLTAKSTIAPLLQSKPAEYKTKLATAQTDLMSGLKGTLSTD